MREYGRGRVYRQKGSQVWRIRFSCRGKRYDEATGTRHIQEARRKLNQRLGEVASGRFVAPAVERVVFEHLEELMVNDYEVNGRRTLDGVKRSIDHLRVMFGNQRAVDITRDRVNAYIAERLKARAAPATVRKEVAALGRMFALAVRDGRLAGAPRFTRLKVENTRTESFNETELAAVLDVLTRGRPATAMAAEVKAQPDLAAAVLFAAWTGWRIKSDVLTLTWDQVDRGAGTVTRWGRGTSKARSHVVFPYGIVPELKALLDGQRERDRADSRVVPWVFHRNGKPIRSFHHAWRAACRAAGLPSRIPHDLRRTGARWLRALGMSDRDIAELCGWDTVEMVSRYLGRDPAGVAERLRLKVSEAEARKVETLSRR